LGGVKPLRYALYLASDKLNPRQDFIYFMLPLIRGVRGGSPLCYGSNSARDEPLPYAKLRFLMPYIKMATCLRSYYFRLCRLKS